MSPTAIEQSDALHARVQAFIHQSMSAPLPRGSFDALACDIARFQASQRTGLERLLRARAIDPHELADANLIPAVPTDVFKLRRVACHEPALDETVFRTSGTTVGARGQHAFRTTATYRAGARAWGRAMLFPDLASARVIVAAPDFSGTPESSLGFMLDDFARFLGTPATWLVRGGRIDLEQLHRAVDQSRASRVPVIVAGAAFAFVHLLDALGGSIVGLPPGSRVMQTGGFKGRVQEVDGAELRSSIARAFGVEERHVVGEYGMTELGSQAYEGVLRSALGLPDSSPREGVYFAPPWMRVSAVDPISLLPVTPGEPGIARIVDLANVDSAVALQTADRIRAVDGGFELLGRQPGATPRGCSIGIDEILGSREPGAQP